MLSLTHFHVVFEDSTEGTVSLHQTIDAGIMFEAVEIAQTITGKKVVYVIESPTVFEPIIYQSSR